jgi:hypothetical protein
MNYWFFDYPKWESDLLKLGLEKFIQKTKDYHFNDPAYIGMIRDFYER